MDGLLEKIAFCVEFGRINKASPYPKSMKGEDGADELTQKAIEQGINPADILNKGMLPGMKRVGVKFKENKVFVPEVMMSAKAMSTAMEHLRPFFISGSITRKGTFIIGAVAGDLHDIGKNLVSMVIEGSVYNVIDLGTDVDAGQFIKAIRQHPGSFVGLSALLTTTMANMRKIVAEIKAVLPDTKIIIGGAPVNEEFRLSISADFYSPEPHGAVEYLNELVN